MIKFMITCFIVLVGSIAWADQEPAFYNANPYLDHDGRYGQLKDGYAFSSARYINHFPVEKPPVTFRALIAADLLKPTKLLHLEQFDGYLTAPLNTTGRIFFWQNQAPISGQSWKALTVQSTTGVPLKGRAILAASQLNVGPVVVIGHEPWISFAGLLSKAGITSASPDTWIVFEDLSQPIGSPTRYVNLYKLRAASTAYATEFEKIHPYYDQQTEFRVTRISKLPDTGEAVVVPKGLVFDWGGMQSYARNSVLKSIPFVLDGMQLRYDLYATGVNGITTDSVPPSGHFVPRLMVLESQSQVASKFQIMAYRFGKKDGKPFTSAGTLVAQGQIPAGKNAQKIDLSKTENPAPRYGDADNYQRLLLIMKINGRNIVIGYYYQGYQGYVGPNRGSIWPF